MSGSATVFPMERPYMIRVCPVCREQIPDDSYEESGACFRHPRATPVEVEVELPATAEARCQLVAWRDAEIERERHWEVAAARVFAALSEEEKRERLGPAGYAMHTIVQDSTRRLVEDLNRPSPFLDRLRSDPDA